MRAIVLFSLLVVTTPSLAQTADAPSSPPAAPAKKEPNFVEKRIDEYKGRASRFVDTESAKGVQGKGSMPWDLTGLIASFIPAQYRAWTLVGLDMLLPLVVAAPVAVLGAVAGAIALTQLLRLTSKRDIPVYSTETLSGAALGAVGAGAVSLFLADLLFNTFHLKWLITPRFVGLAILGVGAGLLTAGLLVLGPLVTGFHPILPMLLLVGGTVALGAFFVVLVPVALAASIFMRLLNDEEFGSPMWQPGGRTGLE